VLNSDKPVLVDFFTAGCVHCKAMERIVDQLAADYQGRASVHKLDAGQASATAQKYDVTGVPTFLVFKGGEVVERIVGATDQNELAAALDAALE